MTRLRLRILCLQMWAAIRIGALSDVWADRAGRKIARIIMRDMGKLSDG